jgi:L-arabinonolactonase
MVERNVMEPVVFCVQQANAVLGEGPIWHVEDEALYWVDIKRPAVFRFDPVRGQTGHWPMPHPIGFVAQTTTRHQLVFGDAKGFGLLDLRTGSIKRISDIESGSKEEYHKSKYESGSGLLANRFNDGKVDAAGRVWAGTIDDACYLPTGTLYRLDPDCSVRRMATRFRCANGLGWSPDHRIMYFTDSMLRTIWAYEFDLASGEIGARHAFATLSEADGLPDGLAVDCEGYLWSAIWDGWRIVRFAPNGSVDREVRLPVQRPTSCMFGGAGLRTLYVTSASGKLDAGSLLRAPLAGSIFALECEIPGQPERQFNASRLPPW